VGESVGELYSFLEDGVKMESEASDQEKRSGKIGKYA